jgi:glycine reductase
VTSVAFGERTEFSGGALTIDRDELRALLLESPYFDDVQVDLIAPGDDVRVVHILDVVEPRVRVSDRGVDFPGIVGPIHPVGMGVTNRLDGIAVTSALEPLPGEPTHWREAILDMSGEAARTTGFSELRHVVLSYTPSRAFLDDAGSDPSLYNVFEGSPEVVRFKNEVRAAGMRAAVYLAQSTRDMAPDGVETFPRLDRVKGLPRMIFLYQMQGPRFYGTLLPRAGAMTAEAHMPLYVNPAEVLDGGLTCMSSLGGSRREFTYLMQNHGVIREMYARHGTEIDFLGVLLCSSGDNRRSKQTLATSAAGVARYLGADGAVLNTLGAGHPQVDMMVSCKELERYGIRTVLLMTEMQHTPGESGFTDYVPEADAIVSHGNFEEKLQLPAVARVIGGTEIMVKGFDAKGPFEISTGHILSATNPLGMGRLRGIDV